MDGVGGGSVRDRVERDALDHNHGAIFRRDALAAGMTVAQINRRRRRGQWLPLGPAGWYVPNAEAANPLSGLAAATRALSGPAWVESSLALFELRPHPAIPMVATARRYTGPGVAAIHVTELDELPRTTVCGIETVTAAVAVVAAGRWQKTDGQLHELIDEAIRRGLTNWREVEHVLRLFPRRGRAGSTLMRQVLDDHAVDPALPLSAWGRRFVVGLSDTSLPRPFMEYRVLDQRGRLVAQVDAAYPRYRYAIELDSQAYHLNPDAFESDRERDGNLAQHGWLVRRFTWQQWTKRRPWVVATIQADLTTRGELIEDD